MPWLNFVSPANTTTSRFTIFPVRDLLNPTYPSPCPCKGHIWHLFHMVTHHLLPSCISPFRQVFIQTRNFLLNSGLFGFLKSPHHEGPYWKPFRNPSRPHQLGASHPHTCSLLPSTPRWLWGWLHFVKAILTFSLNVIAYYKHPLIVQDSQLPPLTSVYLLDLVVSFLSSKKIKIKNKNKKKKTKTL